MNSVGYSSILYAYGMNLLITLDEHSAVYIILTIVDRSVIAQYPIG